MTTVSTKVIAGCFGLSAFAVAILAGLASNIAIAQILLRAVVAMVVCYPVGLIVGSICTRVISASIEEHARHQQMSKPAESEQREAQTAATQAEQEQPITV